MADLINHTLRYDWLSMTFSTYVMYSELLGETSNRGVTVERLMCNVGIKRTPFSSGSLLYSRLQTELVIMRVASVSLSRYLFLSVCLCLCL